MNRYYLIKWLQKRLEISHGSNTPIPSMEGIRGIAVFLVFLVHYNSLVRSWVSGDTIYILNFISQLGHLGVDLFFVLSGYLIYGSIMKQQDFIITKYVKRRMLRIYPTFLMVFSIYIVLSFLFPNESKLLANYNETVIRELIDG